MWELESWELKNWCFWTVVLEKTLKSLLDCKEIKQVKPKGNQSWIFIGRCDAEAEAPLLWSPDAKNWLIVKTVCWKRLKAGGEGDDRGWDGWVASLIRWRWVWVNSRSWWWTGSLSCCDSWGCKEMDTTQCLHYVQMWELDHKKGWVPKNWCFWCGVGEDSWESLGQQRDQTSQT